MVLVALLVASGGGSQAFAAISIPVSPAPAIQQNFDSIGTSATAALPADWKVEKRTGVRGLGTFAAAVSATERLGGAGLSTSAANGIYNFGSGTGTTGADRAIGFVSSGTATQSGNLFVHLVNNSGSSIPALQIAFDVEKYRNGSNASGFSIEMYYSTDGSNWTSAGASFKTSFPADANNNGFATAPGATSSVSSSLNVPIPNGSNFYLAWNYSVTSGTTTSNAQALAIDSIVIGGGGAVSTDPTASGGLADPSTLAAGESTLLTVNVSPGGDPTSTGLTVTGDLSPIGGSPTQLFYDNGTNGDEVDSDGTYSYEATVDIATTAGAKTLDIGVEDDQERTASTSIVLTIVEPAPPMTISEVYGGGGNSGAPYNKDFIELYNPGFETVDLSTWSVQYASSGGSSWQVTPLTGEIHPGGHYLISQGGGSNGDPLPAVDDAGSINMSGTNGKVALVTSQTPLSGSCPAGSHIGDFVGYGSLANCFEGAGPTGVLSNTTSASRNGNGATDTDNNAADFTVGAPDPDNSGIPEGSGGDNTSCIIPTQPALLTIEVIPGVNPVSTGLTVIANLTAIGGNASQAFYDNATNGDITGGDNVYSYEALVGAVSEGTKTITFTVTDAQARTSNGSFTLIVPTASFTPIDDIQGSGAASTMVGSTVTTRGIVTGVRSNGFYLQTSDEDSDGNPATSDAVLVFLGTAPAVSVGDEVQVTGVVEEYFSFAGNPTSTELTDPTFCLLSSDNDLPTPVAITAADLPSNGAPGQIATLENREHMRVTIASLDVVAPTEGFVNEVSATAESNGVFFGVITGTPRPFREPGIETTLNPPTGSPCCIPEWDTNPEMLRFDGNGLTGAATIDVNAGATITGLVGILDWGGFVVATLYPDPDSPHSISGEIGDVPVRDRTENEMTIASFNLERFFDDNDDPAVDEAILTTSAYGSRLEKASLAIRETLGTPDILGIVEIENLSVLEDLAAQINADAVVNPQYEAYLEEGNDIGGIDVGFLVKSTRVNVISVVQEGKTATYTNPVNSEEETLNDRPPLVLEAEAMVPGGSLFPVTVIVNHLRSLGGVEEDSSTGKRVRAKRRAQAEFLANLIQQRQAADPTERIVVVGDFNAFQFNDGYGDLLGTIVGNPTPAPNVVLASSDLVDPNLINLVETLPQQERYSYVFDGSAQVLDHALVTENLLPRVTEFDYARLDADYPESLRGFTTRPERISDHDAPVVFIDFTEGQPSDLVLDAPAGVLNTDPFTVTVTAVNQFGERDDSYTGTVHFTSSDGSASLPGNYTFTEADAGVHTFDLGFTLNTSGTQTITGTDTVSGTISDSATIEVDPTADLSITKSASPDPVIAGSALTYTITASNDGPDTATDASWSDTLPAGTIYLSFGVAAGWSCNTPSVGSTGTVSCSAASFGVTDAVFTVTVGVSPTAVPGDIISNTASISSDTTDLWPGNEDDTATAVVGIRVFNVGFDVYNQGRGPSTASQVRAWLSDRGTVGDISLGSGGRDREIPVEIAVPAGGCTTGNCTPALVAGASTHYTTGFDAPAAFGRLENDIASPNSAVANLDGSFTVEASSGSIGRVGFLFERYLWVDADTEDVAGQTLPVLKANDAQGVRVPVQAPRFSQLSHLSATFDCLTGGSGNGTPRLEIHFQDHGTLGIRLGNNGSFSEPCETLDAFSGQNVIGDDTEGRYDTSGLTGVAGPLSSSTEYEDALDVAGSLVITRIDFVASDSGVSGRSFRLDSIDVAPPTP